MASAMFSPKGRNVSLTWVATRERDKLCIFIDFMNIFTESCVSGEGRKATWFRSSLERVEIHVGSSWKTIIKWNNLTNLYSSLRPSENQIKRNRVASPITPIPSHIRHKRSCQFCQISSISPISFKSRSLETPGLLGRPFWHSSHIFVRLVSSVIAY